MGRRERSRRKPSAAGRPRTERPADESALRERYARSRERDAEVRAELEPLAVGERPVPVTVAAVLAAVMAVANVVASLYGADLGSNAVGFTVLSTVILLACAGGMWFGARYWAVLGFMMILVLQILSLSFALLRVRHWWGALIIVAAIGLLGWLFFRLIRSLARIQMPDRPPARPR